jgi:hypothetical protein
MLGAAIMERYAFLEDDGSSAKEAPTGTRGFLTGESDPWTRKQLDDILDDLNAHWAEMKKLSAKLEADIEGQHAELDAEVMRVLRAIAARTNELLNEGTEPTK